MSRTEESHPEIRPARDEDVSDLVDLWIRLMDHHSDMDIRFVRSEGAEGRWAKYVEGLIDSDDWLVIVAETGAMLVGYAVATVEVYPPIVSPREYGFLQEILVLEEFRRSGVARRLYQEAERWLLSRGVPQIQVKVDTANAASLSFWEKQGFGPYTETLVKRFDES